MEEVSRLLGVHKNTVRNWLQQGLTAIDEQRPAVVRGVELRRFLTDRRTRAKQTCGPGRIYCLPCRAPKIPAGNLADCIEVSATTATLQGICPDCNRMIYRRISPQKIDAIRGELDVTITQGRSRMGDLPADGKALGLDDPLFPATKVAVGNNLQFAAAGLDRKHWSSASPIRQIFKEAFAAAGHAYFNPHSFRKTLALLGGRICRTPEEYKAWSQNLGHDHVMTTFSSYGDVGSYRQAEIIRAFSERGEEAVINLKTAKALMRSFSNGM